MAAVVDRAAIALLMLLVVVAALTFRSYGLGWDDYTHSQYGDLLLSMDGSGFRDTRALSFVNLYLYGGGFDMAAQGLARLMPFDPFETRRLVGAAIGLVGLAATWRIGRRIGGPLAGLLALTLLAACPLYYGHMFINAKDSPFAAAMALFLLGLVRLAQQYPEPSASTRLILGLGFGLAIGSRVLAGFGALDAVLVLAVLFAIEARQQRMRAAVRRLGRALLALVPSAILALALMALLWPWSVTGPWHVLQAVEIFSHFFEKPWRELFNGVLIEPPDMPRSYVPTLLGLKLPLLFLALAIAGLVGTLVAALRLRLAAREGAALLAVVLAALLPLAVAVIGRPAMYNGVRHFVFVLPPLAVLGGLAGAWTAGRAARLGRAAAVAVAAGLAAGIALPALGMARLHPYEYVSFNAMAGGVRGAQHRFMLDYWGLAFRQAGKRLRETLAARGERPPAGRHWRVAVCGPHPPAHMALGDDFDLTWDIKGADLALTLGVFYCNKLDAPVLVEIARDGVVFARAYDVRGRKLRSVFTYPDTVND
jgi:4-amino-4-deoxy-L-arabinose transferase-like glycosyltransferase